MAGKSSKDDQYYPLRWKVADFVENMIILHRGRFALAVAVFALALIGLGVLILQGDLIGEDEPQEIVDEDGVVSEAATSSSDTTATNSPTTSETQAELPPPIDPSTVTRPVATAEQVASTTAGLVIELGPRTMRLTGGAPSDSLADTFFDQAVSLFPNREALDDQLLSNQFPERSEITIRIIEPALFVGEGSDLNPDLSGLITEVSGVALTTLSDIEVVGHANTEPLSVARAQSVADALVEVGTLPDTVTVTGLGNSEPLPGVPERIDIILR